MNNNEAKTIITHIKLLLIRHVLRSNFTSLFSYVKYEWLFAISSEKDPEALLAKCYCQGWQYPTQHIFHLWQVVPLSPGTVPRSGDKLRLDIEAMLYGDGHGHRWHIILRHCLRRKRTVSIIFPRLVERMFCMVQVSS